jgi:import inner membrane translocase subunit TIM23
MALFGLFGGDAASAQPEQPREHTTSADLFASANFDPHSQSQSPSTPNINPAGPSTSAPAPQLPSALDTLGGSAYDPAKLHPLAGLGDKLDFLQLDEDKLTDMEGAASVLPSRGWTDDLCVGTGTTYVSGEQAKAC